MKIFAIAALLLAAAMLSTTAGHAAGCGLTPLKPLVPLGCRDLVARCVCDKDGQNCAWTWVCVPDRR